MDKLFYFLRTDKELNEMRKEWKEKFNKSFPPYNYDEYKDINDYKKKIKENLKD